MSEPVITIRRYGNGWTYDISDSSSGSLSGIRPDGFPFVLVLLCGPKKFLLTLREGGTEEANVLPEKP